MDRASTLADLIHDILDFIAQALVFTANFIKLNNRFFIGSLDTEQLRGCISAFFLSHIKVHAHTINLALPFSNNLVKLPSLLLHLAVQNLSLVQIDIHLLNFCMDLS